MSTEQTSVATIETYEDGAKDQSSTVRLWLDAIGIATNEEQDWRKDAQASDDLYRQSGKDGKKFNILHANVETLVPALYNSEPIPDVRRRFDDADPVAKTVSDIQERCLQYSVESYDFDHLMKLATRDCEITGRAVDRVRYKPYLKDDQLAYQEVACEHVNWKHFRRGPGYVWDDVPWIAFELFLTREELEKLSPKFGSQVSPDVSVNKPDQKSEDRTIPDIFKRARVWEIWDKERRKVIFIAESFKQSPIREEQDPLELEGFFPIPRPLYAIATSTSLIPVVPYEVYKAQAEELERVSERIVTLTEAVKAKALYDSRLGGDMERLESSEDADNVAVENIAIFSDGSKLADHVMFYPIEIIVGALEKLYIARDQIKQTIYEITGIADILRGDTDPNETLGAQQLKANWGSLRIQNKQQEIQRYARDIFRIKAEIFASKFEPQYLEMMTGIPLMPQPTDQPDVVQHKQAVMQMLRTDKLRGFRVDVESDSTIRADMTRNQQTMAQYIQSVAQFGQAMGPLVMADKKLMPAVMQVFASMSRQYKLGRSAEDAIEKVIAMAEQQADQPEQPDPALQLEKEKAAAEQQNRQAEMQMKAQESQAKLISDKQNNDQKLAFEEQKHAQTMQFEREKHANEMQARTQEAATNAQLKREEVHAKAAGDQEKRHLDHDAKLKDTEAKSKPIVQLDANEAVKGIVPGVEKAVGAMAEAAKSLGTVAQSLEQAAKVISAPRRTKVIRGKDGRASESISEMVQ